eukprot:14603174-Ditylum_brightwellii.AAC.1
MTRKNNESETKKRKIHHYQLGDEMLIKSNRATKFGRNTYNGPYPIGQVNNNGTVKVKLRKVSGTTNIRNIKY